MEKHKENNGIIEVEREIKAIQDVCKKFVQVNKAVIFGSRARGSHKRTSDIDICFFGVDSNQDYLIEDAIEEIDTYYSFDCLFFEQIEKEELKQSILRDQIIIYIKDDKDE